MKIFILQVVLTLSCINLFSQETGIRQDTLRKDALNVFMETTDYIRKEIPYVNYVRDIKEAGVYIISTYQRTGSGGGASLIHDQLNLVKQDLTTDEILLQRKELATQYQFFTSFGFSYTFGSIYNNVVNPRFGNSGGGGMTIIMN